MSFIYIAMKSRKIVLLISLGGGLGRGHAFGITDRVGTLDGEIFASMFELIVFVAVDLQCFKKLTVWLLELQQFFGVQRQFGVEVPFELGNLIRVG
ncbi:hypothetical protein N7526_001427 [Penicillium atrosanguineum]|nr:hypothetical protein N7526_001427 [Penicillium atrosanguineum]